MRFYATVLSLTFFSEMSVAMSVSDGISMLDGSDSANNSGVEE